MQTVVTSSGFVWHVFVPASRGAAYEANRRALDDEMKRTDVFTGSNGFVQTHRG